MWVDSGTKCQLHLKLFMIFKDSAIFLLPLMVIQLRFFSKIVDVETTFLYGDLEEEFNMECPQGTSNVGRDDCNI